MIVTLVGFVVPRVMLQFYGSEINGLVTSITQFISYFSLVEAGLGAAAIYALYKPLAQKDHQAVSAVVTAARNFYYQSGFIFVGLTFVLAVLYPLWIKVDSLNTFDIGVLVVILGFNGALEFFALGKYRSLLTADQKSYIISNAQMVYWIVYCLIIVCLSYIRMNIVIVRLIALSAYLIQTIILWLYCRKNYPYIDYKVKPNKKAMDKRWSALYLQILGAVQSGAPTILATVFTSLLSVSVYSIFNMVLSGINSIIGVFTSGSSASFGDIIVCGETDKLQKTFKEFQTIFYGLSSIVYATSFVLITSFVQLYTAGIHDANYNQPVLGFLFVLNGLLYNLKTPQGMLVIAAGLYKETRWQTTAQGVILVVMGLILAPKFGLVGIMIASCLSNLYRDLDLLFFIPKWVTHLPVRDSLFRMLRCVIIQGLIISPFLMGMITLNITNYLSWILHAICVCIVAFLITAIVAVIFEKDEVIGLLKRFSIIKR